MPRRSQEIRNGPDLRKRITVDLDFKTAAILQKLLDKPRTIIRMPGISAMVRHAINELGKAHGIN